MPFEISTACLHLCPLASKCARIDAREPKRAVLSFCSAFRWTLR